MIITPKQATAWFLVGIVVALIVWDVVIVGLFGLGSGATVSWTVYSASKDYPIIPFAAGFACGHFFFPMKGA